MTWFKNISIRKKVILVILTIFTFAATLSFVIFAVNESKQQKNFLKQNALLLAKFTGEYCSAPLFFDIKEETSQMLEKLNTSENLIYAAIYDYNDNLYDSFNPFNDTIPLTLADYSHIDSIAIIKEKSNTSISKNSVLVKNSISYHNIRYGTVLIKYSLDEAKIVTRKNVRSAGVTILFLLLVVFILALLLQKVITEPITELANVTETIKQNNDYSIRLTKRGNDEIGILYDRFNNMLDQIELHHIKRDQTEKELKEAKEKAEEADNLKSAFLANMSHEIRTPMNSIVGFAAIIRENDLAEEERNEYIDLINSSCDILLHLIDDILDISKIEAGQLSVVISKCDIKGILQEIYATFKEINLKNNNNRVRFLLNIPDEIASIEINSDEIRLKQIIANLLSNAIKFTHSGYIEFGYTTLERITSSENKKYLKFYVKDSGIGISNNLKDRIFDRFTKTDHDHDNNKLYRGTGLGLTISKKLVEILGGDIWVSSSEGLGSTFYFTIPLPEDAKNKIRITEEHISIQKSKIDSKVNYYQDKYILIVEDDPINFQLLRAILRKKDVEIAWAKNGVEAIDCCKARKPDLILMDIKMPDMDGFEAVKNLRQLNITAPIIAQTAYARIEDESHILNSGFDAYLSKPIEKTKLFDILNEIFVK